MKILTHLSFLAVFLLSSLSASAMDRVLMDNGWSFCLGNDSTWALPSFDDSQWRRLDLPHDWSIEGEFDRQTPAAGDGAYLPTGIGWYRLSLQGQPLLRQANGRRIRLYFEGVYMQSTVYLNGTAVGGHPYGYSGFWIDITERLLPGRNLLAVKVDNSAQKNCRWYSGSGIYRHVWCCMDDPSAIDDPWQLYIRTEQLYGISADGMKADSASLRISYPGRPDEVRMFRQVRLWSPEQPTLYTIQVGGLSIEHGFRQIEFSTEGLKLNGRPYLLNGGCVHHDNGVIGAAAFDDAEWRKARQLKEAGFNAVRTAHNPASETFITACDHLGLLVIDEAFDGLRAKKNPYDYHKLIDQWWQQDVDALVLRDRNHPSVMAWSNGNELFERRKIEVITTSRKLARRMRQLDPSRPVTQALCEVDSIFDPLAETLDIAGYNYLIQFAERDHQRCPDRIIWQTESYADSAFQSWDAAARLPYVIGDFVWTAIDYLGESGIGRAHYASDPADRGEHWEGVKWPWHGAYCGDIDLTGLRKPISYYRQMLWDDAPALHIGVREPDLYVDSIICTKWSTWPTTESWDWPGHEGRPIQVEVYSRYPRVRLYLNDQLVGEKVTSRQERFKATFTLPYQPGTLRAVGLRNDMTPGESQTISTSDRPASFALSADTTILKADGQSLSFVEIQLVDAQGNPCTKANDLLNISLSGPAQLLGIGNGDLTDTVSYAAHVAAGQNSAQHRLWHGRAIAVIRSSHKAGRIKLSVSGAGVKGSLSISAKR
ncbi:MAG: DUF4982 domain-containing protein [Bacteroidales bacterium]|nr:DUF4982 domain-containing protein [Bacteroidales bacterium]